MKKLAFLIIAALFVAGLGPSDAWAIAYTRYVDADAATGGDGSTTGTAGATCAFKTLAQVNTFISTTMTTSDTATIYFQYGDTFNHASASANGIQIRKSHVTLDAYGTASNGRPIITGGGSYPSSSGYYLISAGSSGQEVVSNVSIKNLEIGNTLSTGYGGGIQFNGRTSGGNTYAGYGLIENCYIHDCGGPAISLWYVDNSAGDSTTAVSVNNNEITNCATRIDGAAGSPQTIDTCGSYSYNNICSGNLIYDSYREGIGACGFGLVEDNTIINPTAVGIYLSDYSSASTIIRRNLIYRDTNNSHASASADGIRLAYEGTNTSNTTVKVNIYENVIIGLQYRGIYLKGWSTATAYWGPVRIFNNTLIDNLLGNFGTQYSPTFSDIDLFNNTSIVFDSTAAHFHNVGSNTSYATWAFGPNHFYGDGIGGSSISPYFTVGTDKTGSPGFDVTSGWRSLIVRPDADDYTPKTINGSTLIDAGSFPVTFTGKSSNTLTGVSNSYMFYPTDVIYEDDQSEGTVSSTTSTTVVLADATNFDAAGGSIIPWAWTGSAPDIGAVESEGPPQNLAPDTGAITVKESTSGDAQVAVDGNLDCDSTPTDPNLGDTLAYCWDRGNDGTCDETTADADPVTISGYTAGEWVPVRFTVTDQGGLSDTELVYIQVTPSGVDPVEYTKVFSRNTGADYATGLDTQIWEAYPTTTYNTQTQSTSDSRTSGQYRKTPLSWDVSGLSQTATSAKIRLYRKGGNTGGQTVKLYLCEDAFTASATWNTYNGTNAWTGGDHGQTTEIGSFTLSGAAYDDITLTSLVGLNAVLGSGTFYVMVYPSSSAYHQIYTQDDATYEYAPELYVTYEDVPEPAAPTCTLFLVSPVIGSTLKAGDTVLLAHTCDLPLTYTVVDALDPFSVATDEADLSAVIQSADGETAFTRYFLGTVEAGDVSANLTLSANFVRTNDTLKYGGAGGTEISYNFSSQALGIAVDTTAPASITTTEVCNSSGVAVAGDVTITDEETAAYFLLDFPEGSWFYNGPLSDLKLTCTGLAQGSLVVGYCDTQPSGFGIGYDDWLYCGYPSDGARGTATIPAAIPSSGAKIIDAAMNELANYAVAASFTWILSDPFDNETIGTDNDLTKLGRLAYPIAGDTFTLGSSVTETAPIDWNAYDGSAGNLISYILGGYTWNLFHGINVLGDYSVITGSGTVSGNLTCGTNAAISDLTKSGGYFKVGSGSTVTNCVVTE